MTNNNIVTIEEWAMHVKPGEFDAPELWPCFFSGNVTGHPEHEEGQHVYTSIIEDVDNMAELVFTRNTTYKLGKPSAGYLRFCKGIGSDPWRIFEDK